MTDNEIIKALKCCIGHEDCATCPQHSSDCVEELFKLAIDLINRQQADKEALIAGQETLQKYIAEQQAEIEKISEKFNCQQTVYADLSKIIKDKNIEIERLTGRVQFLCGKSGALQALLQKRENEIARLTATARAQAIKELEDKTHKMITDIYNKHIFGRDNDLTDEEKDAIINFSDDIVSGFENIVEEMVGDNDETN